MKESKKFYAHSLSVWLSSLLLASTWVGCASGPELKKYPRTQINRPYTLPKGVATWNIPTIAFYSRDSSGDTKTLPPIPIPLVWQSSLSDDWQLTWAPLPLLLSHQFNYDESGYLGGSFGLGGGYSSGNGIVMVPSIGPRYRKKLTSTFALDARANFSPFIALSGGPFTWSSDFEILGFFQLSPLTALSVGPDLTFSNRDLSRTGSFSDITPMQTSFQTTLPVSANFYWSFHRQWDFDLSYRLNAIGQNNGAYSHLGVAQFVHFW